MSPTLAVIAPLTPQRSLLFMSSTQRPKNCVLDSIESLSTTWTVSSIAFPINEYSEHWVLTCISPTKMGCIHFMCPFNESTTNWVPIQFCLTTWAKSPMCVLYMKILLIGLSLFMSSNKGCVLYMTIPQYADCWGWGEGGCSSNKIT